MGLVRGILNASRNLSLRGKLISMMLLVVFVALAAGFGVNLLTNIRLYRQETAASADNLTKVLAEFAVAPLLFEDDQGAREVLSRLETSQAVTAAAIYDADGILFASYIRHGSDTSCPQLADAIRPGFEAAHFDAMRPLRYRGQLHGQVFTRLSTTGMDQKIQAYVFQTSLIFLAVLVICVVLAYRLQGIISGPIMELASVAHRISGHEDYSVRVKTGGRDEIGRLYDAFNVMLSRIDARQRERDAAAARLRKSESKYRAIVQDQTDLVFRISPDGTLLFVNDAYARFFDRPNEQIVGTSQLAVVHDEDQRALVARLKNLSAGQSVDHVEYRVVCPGGDTHWLDCTYRAILDDDDQVVELQGVGRDVTGLKQAEAEKRDLSRQLEHSQRLETIGTLAGGIAHDFNNILTPIMGCIELARLELGDDTDAHEQLGVALASSRRARDLVQQILTFSRQADPDREVIRLQEVMADAEQLLRATLPRTIELRADIAAAGGRVLGNSTQLHQLVMNLCTNAFQAMAENGGSLVLVLDETTVADRSRRRQVAVPPGRYVRLRVRDTGPGMTEAVRGRIFDPFYSTKAPGEGTGLGLSVVHGIVAGHGGHISVESRPGDGTSFTVLLPATDEPVATEDHAEKPAGGTCGRILLVDDEVTVAVMATRMLQRAGHVVVAVNDPRAAFDTFCADSEGFDLVITDQTMPGMTGTELAGKLGAVAPGVRVIMSSGFNVGPAEETPPAGVVLVANLQKPYSLAEINRVVSLGLQVESP